MDAVIWLLILLLLTLFNWGAISFHNNKKLHFFWSGIIIGILGPIIAFLIGALFVKMDHSAGGTGEGGAIGAAFIGLMIVGNGILYVFIGMFVKIVSLIKGNSA
ncbi:ABC transporter permease [Neobacillus sp. 114]|uniref:ABC transporter permease n=1 Tax=Neobacillus sp. 114 TaxID=3048535 RepID=UPI0024C24F35|nr:ABC transporter permease [Neobacillus sp. 114]